MENRKIVSYKVIAANRVDDLSHDVNAFIRLEGWQPFGNVAMAVDEDNLHYTQILVKYSTEQDKE